MSIPFDYKIQKNGGNDLGLANDGVRASIAVLNDDNDNIKISLGAAANINKGDFLNDPLENNVNTSGLVRTAPNDVFLGTDKFKFNSNVN